jgi:uncharacterized membrane protein
VPSVGLPEVVVLVATVLIWIAIVAAAFVVARRLVARRRDPAMDALRARFASGEIDEAEYRRLRSVLQGH